MSEPVNINVPLRWRVPEVVIVEHYPGQGCAWTIDDGDAEVWLTEDQACKIGKIFQEYFKRKAEQEYFKRKAEREATNDNV